MAPVCSTRWSGVGVHAPSRRRHARVAVTANRSTPEANPTTGSPTALSSSTRPSTMSMRLPPAPIHRPSSAQHSAVVFRMFSSSPEPMCVTRTPSDIHTPRTGQAATATAGRSHSCFVAMRCRYIRAFLGCRQLCVWSVKMSSKSPPAVDSPMQRVTLAGPKTRGGPSSLRRSCRRASGSRRRSHLSERRSPSRGGSGRRVACPRSSSTVRPTCPLA